MSDESVVRIKVLFIRLTKRLFSLTESEGYVYKIDWRDDSFIRIGA